MCTVTWIQHNEGYELFCNRDEQRTRKPARSPALYRRNNVICLTPIDGQAGGSWIGVNEYGVTCCLLNYYPAEKSSPPEAPISRGLLLTAYLDCSAAAEAVGRFKTALLQRYRPFILLVLEENHPGICLTWDQHTFTIERTGVDRLPLTTSSVQTGEVVQSRKACFQKYPKENVPMDSDHLQAFHKSHEPERSARSVCMHREDARTVSFSHIRVTPDHVTFSYHPRPPCEQDGHAPHIVMIPRRYT